MARFSFGIFGLSNNELQAGLEVYIRDGSGAIVASTQAGVYQYDVVDNNDGSYYVDGLPSGVYSVYVNNPNTPQPELQNVPFVGDDGLGHFSADAPHPGHALAADLQAHVDAAAPHSGHALEGHTHSEADVTDLDKYSQSEVDALLAGKADVGHSHSEYWELGQGLEEVPLVAVSAEPLPVLQNKYKLYVVKTQGSVKLKMVVPTDVDETAFARAVIWSLDLATGTPSGGGLDNPV